MIAIVQLGYISAISVLLSYATDTAFYENRNALSLGLEVELFQQKLLKDTCTSTH